MGKVVAVIIIYLVVSCHSLAQRNVLVDTLQSEKSELANLLVSDNHLHKTSLINRMNVSFFQWQLKSSIYKYELDTIFTQQWNEEKLQSENYFRYNYDFTDEGRRVAVKIFRWDDEENGWRIAEAVYYSFSEKGTLMEVQFHYYIGFLYRTFAKIEYAYTNNLVTRETYFEKIDEEDEWEKVARTSYEYDSLYLLSTVYNKDWDDYDGIWIYKNKIDYDYYPNGFLMMEAGYEYEFYEQYWIPEYKTEYKQDSLDRLIEVAGFVVGLENSIFLETERRIIRYNTENEKVDEVWYEYEYDQDDFLPVKKVDYFSQWPGTLYHEKEYVWNITKQKWEEYKLKNYLSVNQFGEDEILFYDFAEVHFPLFLFNDLVCEKIEEKRKIGNSWIEAGNTLYRFNKKLQVGNAVLESAEVRIFPVPAKDVLNIHILKATNVTLYLFDSTGKLVLQNDLFQQNQINISTLNKGIYFLKITVSGETLANKKLIKH